jgi:hypothetical protein
MSNVWRFVVTLLASTLVILAAGTARAQQQPAPTGRIPAVRIEVERSQVLAGDPFWIEVTVRWPGRPQSSGSGAFSFVDEGGEVVALAPGSPFEVLGLSTGVSFQTTSDPSGNVLVHRERRVRWRVRSVAPGRHEVVIHVEGKVFRDPAAVVEVTPGFGSGHTF